MSRPAPPPRTALDRNAWVKGALDALAEEGFAGLRIEVLAKRLKVTKGSFYWHFKDRQDLLDVVLETWKDGRIRDVVKQAKARPGGERERIFYLLDTYSTNRNRRGILIELAMREWAQRDLAAAVIVREVDAVRLECGRALFLGCGLTPDEASARCLLLYAYAFGLSLVMHQDFQNDISRLKEEINALVAGAPRATLTVPA